MWSGKGKKSYGFEKEHSFNRELLKAEME